MVWTVELTKSAQKSLDRLPAPDKQRVLSALHLMENDPRSGDVMQLHHSRIPAAFRRSVGAYRILFDIETKRHLVTVHDIVRRTTTTYRKR